MNNTGKPEQEGRAFDALLVSALRRADRDEDNIDPDRLPHLTAEEKALIDALRRDFRKRVLRGERQMISKVQHVKNLNAVRKFWDHILEDLAAGLTKLWTENGEPSPADIEQLKVLIARLDKVAELNKLVDEIRDLKRQGMTPPK